MTVLVPLPHRDYYGAYGADVDPPGPRRCLPPFMQDDPDAVEAVGQDTDNIWFTLLTYNTNQIHFDQEYVAKNFANPPFNGRLVVNSLLTFSVVLGLSVDDTSKNGIILGMTDWKALNPVFAGDTIHSESEVLEKRESKTHPNMCLVTILTKGFNRTGLL